VEFRLDDNYAYMNKSSQPISQLGIDYNTWWFDKRQERRINRRATELLSYIHWLYDRNTKTYAKDIRSIGIKLYNHGAVKFNLQLTLPESIYEPDKVDLNMSVYLIAHIICMLTSLADRENIRFEYIAYDTAPHHSGYVIDWFRSNDVTYNLVIKTIPSWMPKELRYCISFDLDNERAFLHAVIPYHGLFSDNSIAILHEASIVSGKYIEYPEYILVYIHADNKLLVCKIDGLSEHLIDIWHETPLISEADFYADQNRTEE